jgi:glycosyltransferase involved in cell wall biosynthesis
MRVAIAKPDVIRHNTPFQAQADLWGFMAEEYGCQVTVFSDAALQYRNSRLQVEALRRIGGRSWFPPYPRLLPALRGYDVIVTADPSLYAYTYWAALAARIWKARLVLDTSVTVAGVRTGLRGRITLRLAKAIFDLAHKVIVTTPLTTQRLLKLGLVADSAKVVELGHPVDANVFHPGEGAASRDGIRILSAGRLVREKGHHLVIEALADMLKLDDVRLLIAGEGPYRQSLIDLCRNWGVAERVAFLGLVDRGELPALYRQCDIFVHYPFTTDEWEEFFGVAVVEAMASALPVVASDCGALRHVVAEGAGFLVGQRDKEALREKVELLRGKPELRAQMGARGRAHVCQRYSVPEVARRCYEGVLC